MIPKPPLHLLQIKPWHCQMGGLFSERRELIHVRQRGQVVGRRVAISPSCKRGVRMRGFRYCCGQDHASVHHSKTSTKFIWLDRHSKPCNRSPDKGYNGRSKSTGLCPCSILNYFLSERPTITINQGRVAFTSDQTLNTLISNLGAPYFLVNSPSK